MLWTKSADDRAFLRQLSREIVAAVVPSELEEFDALIGRYFANPCPPRSRQRLPPGAVPGRTPVTVAVPAVLTALLNLLLMEIEEVGQYGQPEAATLGLKRLLCRGGARGHERIWLSCAGRSGPRVLALTVYIYTQPVAVTVALTRLAEVAYEAASVYGLDEDAADALVPAVIARLSLGAGVA